jgi:1-aminocyclopropane-1-carboxylate deaminase
MLELPFDPPVQKINLPVFIEYNIDVHIKREDLIHPFISGNKWRKLKYVLQDAKLLHKTTLVSFGGAYSNHLIALACAGSMYGFKTVAFVRGEQVTNHMLGLCRTFGMELRFVDRETYRNKEGLYNTISDENSYFIDEGGKGMLAANGCAEMLDTIAGYSHVISAVGTGTTFAGLVNGANHKGIRAEGICVLKGAVEIEAEITALCGVHTNWTVHHQFHGGGYAKTTPELFQFIDEFAAETGILLDQVYTAKMVLAVIELVKAKHYQSGDKLLLIHTGGLLGLLSRYQ